MLKVKSNKKEEKMTQGNIVKSDRGFNVVLAGLIILGASFGPVIVENHFINNNTNSTVGGEVEAWLKAIQIFPLI